MKKMLFKLLVGVATIGFVGCVEDHSPLASEPQALALSTCVHQSECDNIKHLISTISMNPLVSTKAIGKDCQVDIVIPIPNKNKYDNYIINTTVTTVAGEKVQRVEIIFTKKYASNDYNFNSSFFYHSLTLPADVDNVLVEVYDDEMDSENPTERKRKGKGIGVRDDFNGIVPISLRPEE